MAVLLKEMSGNLLRTTLIPHYYGSLVMDCLLITLSVLGSYSLSADFFRCNHLPLPGIPSKDNGNPVTLASDPPREVLVT